MTLTVGGGLLLRSFVSVLDVDPGFKSEQLLTMQMSVPPRYGDPASRLTFYDELEARLRALPGVVNVGGTTRLPLGSTQRHDMLEVEGRPLPRAELPEVEMRRAAVRLLRHDADPGPARPCLHARRSCDGTRTWSSSTSALATRVFPGEDPIGNGAFASAADWLTIIGVVGNIRHGSLEEVPEAGALHHLPAGPAGWTLPRRPHARRRRRR